MRMFGMMRKIRLLSDCPNAKAPINGASNAGMATRLQVAEVLADGNNKTTICYYVIKGRRYPMTEKKMLSFFSHMAREQHHETQCKHR